MAYYQNIELDWNTWKAVEAGLAGTVYYLKNDLQYVPFVVDTANTLIYFTGVNRDPSASGPYAPLASGTKASTVAQHITYTANAVGTAGNSLTIQYVNDAPSVGKESVTVVGNAITVHIVSGVSTAFQVYTAVMSWNAYSGLSSYHSAASAALVSAVIAPGFESNPQVATSVIHFTGGTASVTVLADWTTNFLSGATLVASFSDGIGEDVSA